MQTSFSQMTLGSLEIFCSATELKSFKKTSKKLGLTPAAVSRSIARLEERLGVTLFERNTRNIILTPEGKEFRDYCVPVVSMLSEAERNILGQNSTPSGTLKITVGATYAHYKLSKIVTEFHEIHPNINIELNISNTVVNLNNDQFDIAIRTEVKNESGIISKPIEVLGLSLYASPDYLDRYGAPHKLDDLEYHRCIQYISPSTGRPSPWLLNYDGIQNKEYSYSSSIQVSENPMACVDLAAAGVGIVQTYDFLVASTVNQGKLVKVLPEYSGSTHTFSMVYKANRYFSLRARTFIDFILEKSAYKN